MNGKQKENIEEALKLKFNFSGDFFFLTWKLNQGPKSALSYMWLIVHSELPRHISHLS